MHFEISKPFLEILLLEREECHRPVVLRTERRICRNDIPGIIKSSSIVLISIDAIVHLYFFKYFFLLDFLNMLSMQNTSREICIINI